MQYSTGQLCTCLYKWALDVSHCLGSVNGWGRVNRSSAILPVCPCSQISRIMVFTRSAHIVHELHYVVARNYRLVFMCLQACLHVGFCVMHPHRAVHRHTPWMRANKGDVHWSLRAAHLFRLDILGLTSLNHQPMSYDRLSPESALSKDSSPRLMA